MKLYKISQIDAHGWDTYDSAVVAAESSEAAKAIHPSGDGDWSDVSYRTWASSPNLVTAIYIGEAADDISGVIVASFNAG